MARRRYTKSNKINPKGAEMPPFFMTQILLMLKFTSPLALRGGGRAQVNLSGYLPSSEGVGGIASYSSELQCPSFYVYLKGLVLRGVG